ncbi:hypothetical protein [Azospirillum sp. TSO35-2]|uniref:RSP_7527 family protein n=1 Tax=Azospirillum sp. TSO35-2 TaxID=716796 RepID=UPI001304C3DD|nr:hypothetical protein [Azospirillum sp. TSO35-2]
MSMTLHTDERDARTYDEIILAARQMRAAYLREWFGKLRTSLFGARASHGPGLTPHAH